MFGRNLFSLFSEKTILVADDSDINNSVSKALLQRIGASVLVAVDGQDALNKFSQSQPFSICAVLMDLSMPKMDGYEAAKSIRALDRPDAKSVPIIAVTASDGFADKTKTAECGMNDFLTKPVTPDQLYKTVGRYL